MHQMPFPERCDPCLIWGQIMQISGAHQWFHDIAPFADGIRKTSFDTLLQNMLFMIYSLTFLVTFFIWTDDADCKTSSATSSLWHTGHKSAIVDVFQFSIRTQQIDTRAYVCMWLFSCFLKQSYFNSMFLSVVVLMTQKDNYVPWNDRLIQSDWLSLFPPPLSFGSCVCKKGVSVNPGIPLKCERVWALLSDNYRSKSWLYHCSRQLFPFPGFSFRIRYEDLVEDL